jgi:hypothetical protein
MPFLGIECQSHVHLESVSYLILLAQQVREVSAPSSHVGAPTHALSVHLAAVQILVVKHPLLNQRSFLLWRTLPLRLLH